MISKRFITTPASLMRPHAVAALVLAGLVVAGAAPGWAATYYVRGDGNDANNGLSNASTGAWRTIAKANNTLRAGDRVMVVSLNPSDTSSTTANQIAPVYNGTSAAGGAGRITYLGNPAAPQTLPVPRIRLARSYVTVSGFRAKNGAEIVYDDGSSTKQGDFCVVENCIVSANGLFCGVHDSRFSNNVFRRPAGSYASFQYSGCDECSSFQPYRASVRDTLLNNVFLMGTLNGSAYGLYVKNYSNNNVLKGNKFFATLDAQGVESDVQLLAIQGSYRNTYQDNKWTVEVNSDPLGNGRWFITTIRNGTHDNLFERESLLVDLAPPHFYSRIMLGQISSPTCVGALPAGGIEYDCNRSSNRNVFKECYFKSPSSEIFFQSTADSVTVKNSVFIASEFPGLNLNSGATNATFEHNTFFSETNSAFNHSDGGLTGTNRLIGNIFINNATVNCSRPVQKWLSPTGFVQDQNIFYTWSGSASTAVGTSSSCYSVGPTSSWNTNYGHDPNSRFADPLVGNRTFASFDPALRTGSPAIAAAFPAGYAGAIAPFDALAPAVITDLRAIQVGDQNVVLGWTAPGDDGSLGAATAYDLRFSRNPITAASFASATAVPSQPVPAASGSLQTYVMTGLSPGLGYYFAIKARDDVGNWSTLGTVLQLLTASSDIVKPAPVFDLGVSH